MIRRVADSRPSPLPRLLDACRDGRIDRREFLTLATIFGLAPAVARQLVLPAPAAAQPAPAEGGTLRVQMRVLQPGDPRLWDFPEMANLVSGQLDRLIDVDRDGALHGALLASWEANAEASRYVLRLRPGVSWSDGTPFTAEDVLANFEAWCDRSLPGNSMASRLSTLIDPARGRLREGAVQVLDPLTLRLELPTGDITLLPGLSDYPAAVQRRDLVGTAPFDHGIGTGAFRLDSLTPGSGAVLLRDPERRPWRPARLARIEFVDPGPDPAAWLDAAGAGQIDMVLDTPARFLDAFAALGWQRSTVPTAATVVIRPRQDAVIGGALPYADVRVRQALALAVDNRVLFEIGQAGFGHLGENHHVAPLHPEYAPLPPLRPDPTAARQLLAEAGQLELEHVLVSVDDDWQRATADACAAQLLDAGLRVRRQIVADAEFRRGWRDFGFSVTSWNHRELGVQVHALAYRSGEAWNETRFSDARFDQLLAEALALPDPLDRRVPMREMERILQAEGVVIQPYWRRLACHVRPGVVFPGRHPKDLLPLHEIALAGGP